MIKIEKLSYDFPQKDLYKKISLTIEDNQHCAFIGTNGTGKTTLINMIMDPEEYLYDGKIIRDDNCRIGYVSQFSVKEENEECTVYEFLSKEFVQLQASIDDICKQLETTTDYESILEEYQVLLDKWNSIDGDFYDSNIKKQLQAVGLTSIENVMISKISGGELKLVQVIKAMINMPTLLIMDEPDVFLDFEHLISLKKLINSYKQSLLVITHNRYLLNNCFNKILHLENTRIREFEGNYIQYNFELLCEKIKIQEQAVKDQEEIDRNYAVLDKMRAKSTAIDCAAFGRSVHARDSIVQRLEARKTEMPFLFVGQPTIKFKGFDEVDNKLENVKIDCDNEMYTTTELGILNNIKTEDVNNAKSEVAISLKDYNLAFDESLLENITMDINNNDKIAIIGPNGTGKTSFLRDIYNKKDGITISEEACIGYLSQRYNETINEDNTVFQEMENIGFQNRNEMIEYLSDYGFVEDILDSKIGLLSGGEKNLVQIARIAKNETNLLLLDEPTSHLDTYAQEAFEKAICEYSGTVLLVSHDFYTIANCVDYVYIIEDKTFRKISNRKFRKMIYANHFSKDYIELERKKKELEVRVLNALKDINYKKAEEISIELKDIIDKLNKL